MCVGGCFAFPYYLATLVDCLLMFYPPHPCPWIIYIGSCELLNYAFKQVHIHSFSTLIWYYIAEPRHHCSGGNLNTIYTYVIRASLARRGKTPKLSLNERERERYIMEWRKCYLDVILVPLGFLITAGYHGWLWHNVRTKPESTIIGINTRGRRLWVAAMMKVPIYIYI